MRPRLREAALFAATVAGLLACRGAAGVKPDAAAHEETAIAIAPSRMLVDAGVTTPASTTPTDDPFDATSPIPDHPLTPFLPAAVDAAHLASILATVPELARLGADVRLSGDAGVADVAKRSDGGALPAGQTVTSSPVLWNPEPGVELLVVAGRGATSSFIIALRQTGEDAYRFAASFILDGDTTPVVLAFDGRTRNELTWTSCFGCRGEDGRVRYGSDHRVTMTQR